MPLVIVISSYVAGSRVGGGIAPFVLAPLKVDPVLVPTTLLGRHPGWGPPGGGPVSAEQMRGMLQGIESNGLFGECDAVLTGYFANPEQVEVAVEAIDRIRAAPRRHGHAHSPTRPLVVVDPIMGDSDAGRYVPEAVATALARRLVPKADIVACNLWEFQQLADCGDVKRIEKIAEAARATGRDWMVTSVPAETGIGVMLSEDDGVVVAETIQHGGRVPRGAGDLLKLRFIGGLVSGESHREALARATGCAEAVIAKALDWGSPELPLAACQRLIAQPPEAVLTDLVV
jgi:pyridoxine kinase